MTDHRFWALMGAALGGGIPGDVIDILVWKNVLKSPLSKRVRVSILFGTWIFLGITVSLLPDDFLKPVAVCLLVPSVLLALATLFISPDTKPK